MTLSRILTTAAFGLGAAGSVLAQTAGVPPVNPASVPAPAVAPVPVAQQQAMMVTPTLRADGQFRGSLGLGASMASGNSRSSNLALNGAAVRATTQDKTSLYALLLRSSASGATTGESLRLGGRYDYNLSALMFAFGGLDFERNKLANLKLRSQAAAGLGYHLINTPVTTFDLYGGLAYSSDKFVAAQLMNGASVTSYSYPSLMLGEESTHILSATTSAKQRLVVYPNMKDSGEFRATFDAGVSVAMSSTLSLNVGLGATYNSQPGVGRKELDTLLTTGVSVKFD